MVTSQHNPVLPEIASHQVIDTVAGGTVYGVYVNKLSIPAYTANNAPNEATVLAYLTQLSLPPRPVVDVNDQQQELWKVPVPVRAGEYGVETREIWDAIKSVFTRQNPEHFIQRVLLLGEAGMGRTPALLQIQSRVASESRRWLHGYRQKLDAGQAPAWKKHACVLPIYVSLVHIKAGHDLPTLIRDGFNARLQLPDQTGRQVEEPESRKPAETTADSSIQPIALEQVPALLNRYRCLFLLDDLELIFTGNQHGAVEAVNHFMESNQHQYVIACRASSDWHQLGPVARLYLADFPKDAARALLGDDRYQRVEATAPELVRNRASLHRLLGGHEERILEQSTGLLVQEDIRERLSRHRDVYDKYGLQQEVAERILESMALAMFHGGLTTLTERQAMGLITAYLDEWHEQLNWRDVLAALNEAEMLQVGARLRLWTFRHQRAQAYFAAAAVAANPGELHRVLDKASDYRWRPVLELLTGLLPDPSDFIFELVDRDSLVAAICTDAAGKAAHPLITTAVIDALLERMKRETSLRRQPIVERIGNSGHPRVLETLLLALQQEWSSRVITSIVFAILEWWARHADVEIEVVEGSLMQRSQRQYVSVSEVLIDCRVCWTYRSGKRHGKAVDRLIRLSRDRDRPILVQGLAVIGLGIAGTHAARLRLLELFRDQHADDFLAWCGVEALCLVGKYRSVGRAAIALYNSAEYQSEEWARHRARAVYLLGRIHHGHATSKRLLRALDDPSPFVRSCTVEALAELDWREGAARHQIERRLDTEKDPLVLRRIAEALGRIGTHSTVPRLQPLLRCPIARTRWAARQAIDDILKRDGTQPIPSRLAPHWSAYAASSPLHPAPKVE